MYDPNQMYDPIQMYDPNQTQIFYNNTLSYEPKN